MKKNYFLIAIATSFVSGLIASLLIMTAYSKISIGSLADWLGAIATTSAVLVALWPQIFKRKPDIAFLIGRPTRTEQGNLKEGALGVTNLSDVAAFFVFESAVYLDRETKKWNSYSILGARYFSVMPYQRELEIAERAGFMTPDPDPEREYDETGEIGLIPFFWDEAKITYIDKRSGAHAVLHLMASERSFDIQYDSSSKGRF